MSVKLGVLRGFHKAKAAEVYIYFRMKNDMNSDQQDKMLGVHFFLGYCKLVNIFCHLE